ncbi:transmembrane 6 superfamily member 1-like [Glandiceps talaboti]
MSAATAVFAMSLTAIPVTYSVNLMHFTQDHRYVFVCGVVVLTMFSVFAYLIGKIQKQPPKDWFFYVCAVFAFTSVVDTIIALELDDVIDGFMTFYLKEGEPYLSSAHGTMISYWDGSAHYLMQLAIVTAIAWKESYHEVGLYWAGSIVHSMIVFMPGNLIGKNGKNVKASIFLNTPYVIIPIWIAFRLLTTKRKIEAKPSEVDKAQKKGLLQRPLDMFLIVCLLGLSLIGEIRGMAALDSPMNVTQEYLLNYEPYITDDVIYPKLQMLIYLFYFVPYYMMSIYGLIYPGRQWMIDWSLVHAGAAAQAQFTHIGCSLHSRTPYRLRAPPNTRPVFWLVNLSLLLLPQLLAWRCVYYPEFFVKRSTESKDGKAALEKKRK